MLTKVETSSTQPAADSFFAMLNALFDVHMPCLKDTEFKVLCVAFRQTCGRKDTQTGRRKERDWLSQSQLKKRTGRGGDAVAAAIDALVGKGLLMVEAEDGSSLLTPQARRRHLSRLFYRMGPAFPGKDEAATGTVGQLVGKAGEKADICGEAADIFSAAAPEVRVDKADTTKNKQDRNNSYKGGDGKIPNHLAEATKEELTWEQSLTAEQRTSIEESKQRIWERLRGITSAK